MVRPHARPVREWPTLFPRARSLMSGLEKRDRFAPSKTPYAFLPGSFEVLSGGLARVSGIWAGRKVGHTTAAFGHLTARVSSYEELLETVDMRYGGYCEAKWDGVGLWTPVVLPEKRREALSR